MNEINNETITTIIETNTRNSNSNDTLFNNNNNSVTFINMEEDNNNNNNNCKNKNIKANQIEKDDYGDDGTKFEYFFDLPTILNTGGGQWVGYLDRGEWYEFKVITITGNNNKKLYINVQLGNI